MTFSGDKLLGGPQAGFVVGRRELVERVRGDALSRVCRLDRLRLGALQQTLAAYVTGRAFEEVPNVEDARASVEEIDRRACALKDEVVSRTAAEKWIEVIDGVSRTGGGSSPTGERGNSTRRHLRAVGDAGTLERRLRDGEPPIVGRVQTVVCCSTCETVLPKSREILTKRVSEALALEIAEG